MNTMKLFTGTVIYYFILNIFVVFAKFDFSYLQNDLEDNFHVSCNTNSECENMGLTGFKCVDNLCMCQNMCNKKPEATVLVTKIGKNCTKFLECNIEKSFCNEEGRCDCSPDSVASTDRRKCLNVAYSIESDCEEHIQCLPLNGICKNEKCACPDRMHLDKGICFKSVGLGSWCMRDEECAHVPFSSCKFNKCVCNKNYIASKMTTASCVLKAEKLSSLCSEDIQCSSSLGSGAICSGGICTCSEMHQYKASIGKCVLDARLGDVCGTHTDCHQPGIGKSRLDCVLGECKCKPNYFEEEGYCISSSSENNVSFSLRDILPFVISYLIFYIII